MVARDLKRAVRRRLVLAALRRKSPSARIDSSVIVDGDVSHMDIRPRVTVSGPSVVSVENGGGLHGAHLVIGDRTYIGEFANIRCAGTSVVIGANCIIAQHVSVVGSNHEIAAGMLIGEQAWCGDGVVVHDGVWIGCGAVLLPGSRVGAGAVVAAGAVVTGEVPPGAVVAGVPARVVKMR